LRQHAQGIDPRDRLRRLRPRRRGYTSSLASPFSDLFAEKL
jgi:hypothetical protein